MRLRLPIALGGTVALAFVCAPAALADTTQSSNWAGYAIHRDGVSFSKVIGAWRQPDATCTPGTPSYSAVWVGIGGYSITSNALEQIGTEVDCSATGRVASSAWYELVPAASQSIKLIVRPGDELNASVTVTGHKVDLTLNDLTRHRKFTKTLHASVVDVSSAEWIVEAPSSCLSDNSCQTLPLADFGTASFDLASAKSTKGHTGSIADKAWSSTKITLAPAGQHFVIYQGPGAALGSAAPSVLGGGGSSFKVTYHAATIPTPVNPTPVNPALSKRAPTRAAQLTHPSRTG
jgi:Peptidase A4 family